MKSQPVSITTSEKGKGPILLPRVSPAKIINIFYKDQVLTHKSSQPVELAHTKISTVSKDDLVHNCEDQTVMNQGATTFMNELRQIKGEMNEFRQMKAEMNEFRQIKAEMNAKISILEHIAHPG
ncbi:hypothetical protein N7495_005133 [Penicillium taxi]|uniref:uncharacterized protein n=1 Tax=Penicillium taxi TaxID=168475 RepID=UPI0025457FFB|nr:uncharacterized protein N7495_005133 [Penicillium taxi]KAJ5893442.1 hypothetical protein N7495_005133 [Penicillium taxi]